MENVKTGFIEITSHDFELCSLLFIPHTRSTILLLPNLEERKFFSTKECLFTRIAIDNLIEGGKRTIREEPSSRHIS